MPIYSARPAFRIPSFGNNALRMSPLTSRYGCPRDGNIYQEGSDGTDANTRPLAPGIVAFSWLSSVLFGRSLNRASVTFVETAESNC
jgi:hypothetical protein